MDSQEKKKNFKTMFYSYFRKEDVLKLPNVLCYLRILLSITFLFLYLCPYEVAGNKFAPVYISTAVIAFSAYTDFLDGFIARKFNQKSELGKIVDPIADILTQLMIAIGVVTRFHSFAAVDSFLLIFIVKELSMAFYDIVLSWYKVSFEGAKWFGKLSTFLLYISFGVLLIGGPFILEEFHNDLFTQHLFFDTIASVCILMLLVSAIGYAVEFWRLLKKGKAAMAQKGNSSHD
jgi:cardiolipin synthase